MEGTQITKKRRSPAFLAMLVFAMFFGMGRLASAQPVQVSPNGVGDLLIYQYWFTQDPQNGDMRDSLIALVNAFGGDAQRFVHIIVREGIRSDEVRNFTVCLSPGDVWTAAISPGTAAGSSNLVVGNPGSCDAAVAGSGFTPPPLPGQVVPMAATFGYIEAYTMEGAIALLGGGDDTLFGVATPVNVAAGFSSSYNAVAFTGFNATDETFVVLRNSAVAQALAREGGVDKEVLMTRWFADPALSAVTQIVLTFPGGFQPGAADPVSLFVFDEDENFNFSPRHIFLPWEVNVCSLAQNPATPDTQITFTCADPTNQPFDIVGAGGTFISGWLRIVNNSVGAVEQNSLDAPPATRFPVIGLTFSSFEGVDQFDQSFNIHWAAIRGAGGIGGTACNPLTAFCRSYNLTDSAVFPGGGTFSPWFLPGFPNIVQLIVPGDSVTGALNRTGTVVP